MNSMVRQFLYQPTELYEKLNNVNMEITALELSMLPGAIRYDKDNVQSTPEDKMVGFAVQMDRLLRRRDRLVKEYRRAYAEVQYVVDRLPERERCVVGMKYLRRMSNAQISEAVGISPRWVMKLCDNSYTQLQDMVLTSPLKYDIL